MPLNCFAKLPSDKTRKAIFNKALTQKLKQLRGLFSNFKIVEDNRVDSAELDITAEGDKAKLISDLKECGINQYNVSKNRITIPIQNIHSSEEEIPIDLNELFLTDNDFKNLLSGIVSEYIRKDNTGKEYVHKEDYAKKSIDLALDFDYLKKATKLLKDNTGILRIRKPLASNVMNKMADKFTKLWYKMNL